MTNNNDDLKKLLETASKKITDPRGKEATETDLTERDCGETKTREKKKRKCANCTCSLSKSGNVSGGTVSDSIKSSTDNIKSSTDDTKSSDNIKSSCGSCYLGDAFRCAGCPYRGMPAFEEGEEVKLQTEDLDDL